VSLALQTLGFHTIPTTKGARRGDIICITGKASPVAVLVEAKTSAHPYRLPVKDERALQEYAQQLRAAPRFNFPLRLIIIIGPQPHERLSEHLHRLEIAAKVPVRYCSASTLATVIRKPPTGVTVEELVDALLSGDPIVPVDHLISISSKAEEELAALRNLINLTLRSSSTP